MGRFRKKLKAIVQALTPTPDTLAKASLSAATYGLADLGYALKEGGGTAKVVDRAVDPGGSIDTALRDVGEEIPQPIRQVLPTALGTVGQYWGPAVSAAFTGVGSKLAGEDYDTGFKRAGAAFAGGELGAFAGDAVGGLVGESAGNIAGSTAQGATSGAVKGGVTAGLMGGDVGDAMISGGATGGLMGLASGIAAPSAETTVKPPEHSIYDDPSLMQGYDAPAMKLDAIPETTLSVDNYLKFNPSLYPYQDGYNPNAGYSVSGGDTGLKVDPSLYPDFSSSFEGIKPYGNTPEARVSDGVKGLEIDPQYMVDPTFNYGNGVPYKGLIQGAMQMAQAWLNKPQQVQNIPKYSPPPVNYGAMPIETSSAKSTGLNQSSFNPWQRRIFVDEGTPYESDYLKDYNKGLIGGKTEQENPTGFTNNIGPQVQRKSPVLINNTQSVIQPLSKGLMTTKAQPKGRKNTFDSIDWSKYA